MIPEDDYNAEAGLTADEDLVAQLSVDIGDTPNIEFDDDQIEAIRITVNTDKRVAAVTGQAGTGKTSVFREAYRGLREAGHTVLAVAPTGRAARRITEVNGIPARTIHKALEYPQPGEVDPKTGRTLYQGEPKRNESNPLPFDVVLVDEAAMVSKEVAANLVAAIKRGTGCLRLFGDVNQLAPIEETKSDRESPSFFQNILKDKSNPSVKLTTIHRQGEGSGIIELASQILSGKIPQSNDEARIRFTSSPVADLVQVIQKKPDMFRSLDAQIISPMKKSWVGTVALNQTIQRLFYDDEALYIEPERHSWDEKSPIRLHKGDKVIWTKNDYVLTANDGTVGLMNGEIGTIGEIDFDTWEFEFVLPDRTVVVPTQVDAVFGTRMIRYNPQKNIDLAYAVTTHKSQGSEFKNVVYVLNRSTSYMQNRNNLYTAVTRASKAVMVITDHDSLAKSVRVVEKRG